MTGWRLQETGERVAVVVMWAAGLTLCALLALLVLAAWVEWLS